MFCTAKKGALACHWRGEAVYEAVGDQYETDGLALGRVFIGAEYDGEWSFTFDQKSLEDGPIFERTYWAEAWSDYETGEIHCYVRRLVDHGKVVFGPNPSQLYLQMKPCKSVKKLMQRLEHILWETKVPDRYLDTKRESSRAYKTYIKKQNMRISIAMAFHDRLGSAAGIQCLGTDLMQLVLEQD